MSDRPGPTSLSDRLTYGPLTHSLTLGPGTGRDGEVVIEGTGRSSAETVPRAAPVRLLRCCSA